MSNEMKRADVALTERGLASSRERAQELIRAGLVLADGKPVTKCSERVADSAALTITGEVCPYVSRGGFKLEKALKAFGTDVAGKVCLDVGASTGGFTDVLLQNGADMVYAVDVGTGQLDPKLAGDARVVSMEHTNARTLSGDMFPRVPTLAVMDVSFISITLILPALFEVLGAEGTVVSLIKPQFEAGPQNLGKNGIVTKPKVREQVLRTLATFPKSLGWKMRDLTYSPIRGTEGNIEFLACFEPQARGKGEVDDLIIRQVAEQAQAELKKG